MKSGLFIIILGFFFFILLVCDIKKLGNSQLGLESPGLQEGFSGTRTAPSGSEPGILMPPRGPGSAGQTHSPLHLQGPGAISLFHLLSLCAEIYRLSLSFPSLFLNPVLTFSK